MSDRAPYSRVYWTVRNDPRLADIYSDDHHWAAWNRLLLAADMAWPAPADLPRSVRSASLAALVAAGVIEELPGNLFRFHGLDSERGRRREAARSAGGTRTPTVPDPNGEQTVPERPLARAPVVSARLVSVSATGGAGGDDDPPWLVAWFQTGRAYLPTPKQRTLVEAYLRAFDVTGGERSASVILSHPDDPIGALKADLAAFRAERAAKAEAEPPPPAPRKRAAGLTGINAELAAAFGERYATEDPKWEAAHHAALVGKAP